MGISSHYKGLRIPRTLTGGQGTGSSRETSRAQECRAGDQPLMGLFQEDSGAADFLSAERVEEARNELVHQLEVRGERGGVLLRAVEDLFPELLGIERRSGAAVDEDELGGQNEAFALHVGPHGRHAAAAELIVEFAVLDDEAVLLVRGEEHRARDDQRVLMLLADALPELDVRENPLILFQILLVANPLLLIRVLRRRLAHRLDLFAGGTFRRRSRRASGLPLLDRELCERQRLGLD